MRGAWAFLGVAASLAAQGWTTFYSAYEDGLAALARGDHAQALRAFERAAQLAPDPGARVKTYGLNFLSNYHPYLRQAEAALALGDLDRAERALQESARRAAEPAAAREALVQRLRQARAAREVAAKPKEPPPPAKADPVPVPIKEAEPPPRPLPAPVNQALPPQAVAEPLRRPAPPVEVPKTTPQAAPAPSPKVEPPGPAPASQALPPAAAPASPPPAPTPAEAPTPAGPSPSTWVGLGLGAGLVAAAGAWLALRRFRKSPQLITLGSNPYRVDLDAHTKGGATVLSPQRAEAAPRRVGPYVITKVLGRGGCATTYLAVHEDEGTEVAVKIPHPHIIIDPDFLARFRREAELGAVLDHPRIVRILDPGPKDGDAWIAMKLVRGTTLESHIARKGGPLDLAEVIHIASEVAEAIAHAHSKGVVHRDLKPANVMLGDFGAQVMDFGIARVLDSTMTATTVFMGTPSYSAPEALANPRVGPPADRYALGIMLFEMLTGQLPFTGATAFQVLEKHRSEPLPDLRALCPQAPARLARLVERLTAKRPEERPEDGEVLTILAGLQKEFPLAG